MSKIAVIQTAFPGDVILCTPVFESLKSAGHQVVAVVRPQAEPLVRHNPYIDKLICYDKKGGAKSFIKTVSILKKEECDIALIVQRYFKSALLPLYAGIHKRIGYSTSFASFLYTDEINYDPTIHEVNRCLALCEGLSSTEGFSPKIFVPDEINQEAEKLLISVGVNISNFIVVAPGSVWQTKRWTGYRQLLTLIERESDCDVVIIGSTDDRKLSEKINTARKAVNIAGKTDLLQSSAIIQKARLLISNDSAPAHIAAAVGTPVAAIFGPTVPRFGFSPYLDNSVVVENKGLYCRPCSSHGPRECPEKHFRCMNEITPKLVWKACMGLLEQSAKKISN